MCYEGREISRSTTIVFERFYESESVETDSDTGLLELQTLWLCTGFTYGDCGIHNLQSWKPVEKQIDEIFESENRHYGPFERKSGSDPYSVPLILENDFSIHPFIYGVVDTDELESDEEEGKKEIYKNEDSKFMIVKRMNFLEDKKLFADLKNLDYKYTQTSINQKVPKAKTLWDN